jgi:uncharacterized protein
MLALPSREQCLALMMKHDLRRGMIKHSVMVSKVAVFLAKKLKETGEAVDVDVVERAALLHDLDKSLTLGNSSLEHAEHSRKILAEEGFPELGGIVAKHRLSFILEDKLDSWEEKLVYYADKRVRHEKIVSLDERFDYLLERYGSRSPDVKKTILECKPKVLELEREIFNRIDADKSLKGINGKCCE